jgi:hypothetical protein
MLTPPNFDTSPFTVPPSDLPPGYDTVASFTAKHSPAALALMFDPLTGFDGDEKDAAERSAIIGIPVHRVPAAPFYRERGVERQSSFQSGLIEGLFRG